MSSDYHKVIETVSRLTSEYIEHLLLLNLISI